MNASNVVSLSNYRLQAQMARRMAQNSLILMAAIQDSRLNRYDLELLAKLLDLRVFTGNIRFRCDPEDRFIGRSIDKLQRAGYLAEATIKDLVIGFRRDDNRTPEPYLICELAERELARKLP